LPSAGSDGVAGKTFDGKITRFEVKKQGRPWIERPELGRLANAGFPDENTLDAATFCQALVCGNDGQAHLATSAKRSLK
jgi:hypothetical protein